MEHPVCPYCGSTEILLSPSGRHQMCASCNRVLIQPRERKPRGRWPAKKLPDSGSHSTPRPD